MPKHYEDTKDLRIKKRGGWYHARFSCRGQRVQKALNTRNFAVAQRLTDDIQNTILMGLNWRLDKELFEESWPEFIEDKRQGNKTRLVRESTLKYYIQAGERFYLPYWGSMKLSEITEDNWLDFTRWVHRKSPGIRLFNIKKYFSGFVSWAHRKGKIQEKPELVDPTRKRNEDREDESPGKVFTSQELELFEKHAEMPFLLVIKMAIYMGMRRSEITQLRKDQIAGGLVRLLPSQVKTGKGRKVPVHEAVMPLLKAQCEAHPESPYLFPHRDDPGRPMDRNGFKKRWNKLREVTGVSGRFHDLRHTYLTMAFNNPSLPHLLVCEAAGLDIRTAQKVYLHFTDDDLKRMAQRFTKVIGEKLVRREGEG